MNITVVTSDQKILIAERNSNTVVAGGMLHTSVASNIPRKDETAPDLAEQAAQAIHEELGILVEKDDIEFRTFTVNEQAQYSLLATLRVPQTASEILRQKPQHAWENKQLHIVNAELQAVAKFIGPNWERFYPVGLVSLAFAALYDIGYSTESINSALQNN